jgi:hypothetical protein
MTTDELDRSITAFLDAEAPSVAPSGLLGRAMDEVAATAQRRPGFTVSFVGMTAAAAAVAMAALLTFQIIQLTIPSVGSDGSNEASPSAVSTPTPESSVDGLDLSHLVRGADEPIAVNSVRATADFPEGWAYTGHSEAAQTFNCCGKDPNRYDWDAGIAFWVLDHLNPSGCDRGSVQIGPTVDDAANAIVRLPGFEATTPEPVTVDGVSGVHFRMTPQPRKRCPGFSHRVIGPGWFQDPDQVQDFWIFDVGGERLIVEGWDYSNCIGCESAPPAMSDLRRQIAQIVESLDFQP